MHQKKSIAMIIFIHLRNENHQMNFIQHVKKNVLYYHFRTTSRLYYSTTSQLYDSTTSRLHHFTKIPQQMLGLFFILSEEWFCVLQWVNQSVLFSWARGLRMHGFSSV